MNKFWFYAAFAAIGFACHFGIPAIIDARNKSSIKSMIEIQIEGEKNLNRELARMQDKYDKEIAPKLADLRNMRLAYRRMRIQGSPKYQAALAAERQYEIVKRNGSAIETYFQASLVAQHYLEVEDESAYQDWKEIQKEEAKRANVSITTDF